MDNARAKRTATNLKGKTLGEWTVGDYIGSGKSALVLHTDGLNKRGAIKVFDPEIVETYGDSKQLERIRRERSLIGTVHPNLIKIFDGGEATVDGEKLYYVVMEFFAGKSLAGALKSIPIENVWSIISQVAAAAEFLEKMELCHRDIKPENIGISDDFLSAKLLDLGVLRPFSAASLTDQGARPFIGTLRYAPPEFLLRAEEPNRDGWRAITFYQLGGVLHDLIMRTPLFSEFSQPYARLVNAVQHEKPTIASTQVSPDLVDLAKRCLSKDPKLRLELVEWTDFQPPKPTADPIKALKAKITKRRMAAAAAGDDGIADGSQNSEALEWRLRNYGDQVQSIIRDECLESGLFPRFTVGDITMRDHCAYSVFTFEPFDTSDDSSVRLSFLVALSWMNPAEDVVRLKVCGVASISSIVDEISIANQLTPIYEGYLSQEKISAAISPLLYIALDAAQQLPQSDVAGSINARRIFEAAFATEAVKGTDDQDE